MRYMFIKITALLIVISLVIGCSEKKEGVDENLHQQIKALIDSVYVYENDGFPAIMVLVKSPKEKVNLLYAKGVKDIDTLEPANTSQIFSIGSNTKTFSVMVLLQLVDEGKINLEDYLSDYFPNIYNSENIKIKHLAYMSSGIPNYVEDFYFLSQFLIGNFGEELSLDDILNFVPENTGYFTPGTEFHYSNTNTILIGEIVKIITGNSIKQEIDNRFINKLSLKNTFYPSEAGIPHPNTIRGYEDLFAPGVYEDFTGVYHPSIFGAAGCMFSNLEDMAKWSKRLANGFDISIETNQLRKEGVVNPAGHEKYMMGIFEVNGWLGHTGGVPGFSTIMLHNPVKDNTVIIVQTSLGNSYPSRELFDKIVKIIYPDSKHYTNQGKSFSDYNVVNFHTRLFIRDSFYTNNLPYLSVKSGLIEQ